MRIISDTNALATGTGHELPNALHRTEALPRGLVYPSGKPNSRSVSVAVNLRKPRPGTISLGPAVFVPKLLAPNVHATFPVIRPLYRSTQTRGPTRDAGPGSFSGP